MGLIKAAKRFDPDKGYTFSTFATRCIKNYILIDIRNSKTNNRKANTTAVSLDEPVLFDEDGDTKSLMDTISSNFDMEEYIIEKEKIELVSNAISKLSPEERQILNWYYSSERKKDTSGDI